MKMTKPEALKRKCVISKNEFCIVDQCMGWRWAEPTPSRIHMEHKSDCARRQISLLSHAEECVMCGAKAVQIELPDQRLGYCGLAGTPIS